MCRKNGVHIPRKCIESMHLTHVPVPNSKLQVEFFEICFPQDGRRRGSCDLLYQKNMKIPWNTSLFTFCMICNVSKCDDFTVL